MDGWALGSVEPGDPRWAPVGDHAVDGQASCLHRHRDDMGWPMAAALSTRSLPHYGSTSATTRTCKRPKTSLSPWWWYTLPTGLITPCVAPTLVAQIQLGTPHGWPVGQHCTHYPTTNGEHGRDTVASVRARLCEDWMLLWWQPQLAASWLTMMAMDGAG